MLKNEAHSPLPRGHRGNVAAGAVVPTAPVNRHAPLVHAVYGGDLQSVRIVLATKPDLAARDVDGWSALNIGQAVGAYAAAVGFVGWNVGSIVISGSPSNSMPGKRFS